MSEKIEVVVIGGSVAGMATALALSGEGHRVTVLEQEVMPPCESPVEAFERWERRGSPQCHHSHAFLARVHNLIRDRVPALYAALLEAGAERMPFSEMVREVFRDFELVPEDDEIVLLACRRMTFDWVLRRHLESLEDVRYLDGVSVQGLVAERDDVSALPRVCGVRLVDASGDPQTMSADLVVDASGRRTQLGRWLEEIGAASLEVESEPCGIFYSSRFYRLHDGVEPPPIEGPIGADLGYMKYAIFPGDSRIFSITLAASPEDAPLRAVLKARAFDAAAAALPATRAWVDPSVSAPITGVHNFASLKNTRRHFVVDGDPLALGIFPVGDALLHTNPLSGRGCTLGFVGAFLLADALRDHPDDPLSFARDLHRSVERELVPWYENMRDQDREAGRMKELEHGGGDPYAFQRDDGTVDPRAYMRSLLRDGLMPALREDLEVLRAFMRIFNLLDSPADLLARPDLLQRILAVWQGRDERERIHLGPSRDQMIEEIATAA